MGAAYEVLKMFFRYMHLHDNVSGAERRTGFQTWFVDFNILLE